MKNGMGHKGNRIDKFLLPLEKGGWVRSGNLASCGAAQRFILLSNTIAGFFNVRGTWHFPNMVHRYNLGSFITL